MEQVSTIAREKFTTIIQNEALVDHELSLPMIDNSLFRGRGNFLYYGTGICNHTCLTIGTPFDVLSMVLVAEKLRKILNLSGVIHHIADSHALCNFPKNEDEVFKKASELEGVMTNVIHKLGLCKFKIVRSSSFDRSSDYLALQGKVTNGEGGYFQRELTDMLWYQKYHNVALKLGWAAPIFKQDERWYDRKFIKLFGNTLSFIYTKPGRTFTESKVPYFTSTEEDRLLLRAGEQVQAKFDRVAGRVKKEILSSTEKYFSAICRIYRGLGYPLNKGPVPQQIQQIIDHIFG